MNRRLFLSLLAGAALHPERLLWVPRRRVISIPKPTPVDLTVNPEVVRLLRDMCDPAFVADLFRHEWIWPRPKIGDTITVRRLPRLTR